MFVVAELLERVWEEGSENEKKGVKGWFGKDLLGELTNEEGKGRKVLLEKVEKLVLTLFRCVRNKVSRITYISIQSMASGQNSLYAYTFIHCNNNCWSVGFHGNLIQPCLEMCLGLVG